LSVFELYNNAISGNNIFPIYKAFAQAKTIPQLFGAAWINDKKGYWIVSNPKTKIKSACFIN